MPPVLICGTGAMASLFAAKLASSGVRVTMLGQWSEGIRALNDFGIRFIDEDGQESHFPVRATDDPADCLEYQFVLVLVKSYQTERVAKRLKGCLAPGGLVLTLQNGLDNRKILAEYLGNERVAAGVTTIGATLLEPAKVRVGGKGMISVGAEETIMPIADLLIQAGFEVELVENTESLIWGKLVINAAINPLTAILRIPNGDLLKISPAHQLMNLVSIESAKVAESLNIGLPFSDPVAAVEVVALKTATNYSSMYKDVARGSQTEIEAINGAIVKAGESTGSPVNFNRMLWLLIESISIKNNA
ncbi:MAG: 2-dehydropantoate 2-reductase [Chloroflexota bacterium]|nr:MAG: 2-dehydropantoate 2-reductase [Chloroflexota bacterium]